MAIGSRVPVWPMPLSRSTRLATATTSCEVTPWGLSTTSTPSIVSPRGPKGGVSGRRPVGLDERDRRGHLLFEDRRQFGERTARAAAGGVLVPPPPNSVAMARTSTSPLDRMLIRHSPGPLSLKKTTACISLTVSGRLLRPSVSSCVPPQAAVRAWSTDRGGDPPGGVEPHLVQHRAEEPQAADVVAVEDGARHGGWIHAGLRRTAGRSRTCAA